ncbi:hypothetical protein [Pseudocnuella soli]|uniref:hypothetical protein n=1 Tax=Pseudocnuella soli TaxID=2502779 RepID=UPI001043883E|nr:hypothetical protein [Pseudocnuella soli]
MTPYNSFDRYLQLAASNRPVLQRFFFIAVLVLLAYYAATRQLLFQLGGNPLFYQELDPTYWLFMIAGAANWLHHPGIIFLDLTLIASAIGAAWFHRRNGFPIMFFGAHFIWFVLYNGAIGHHYAFFGVLFLSLPFAFRQGFGYMLLFIRFVFCFIYGTAALWKIGRGTLFYPTQTRNILIEMNMDTLAAPDGSLSNQLLQWLLAHPQSAHVLWVAMIFLELVFLIGFFTLRFDKWIGVAYLLFAIGGWYFFDVWNYENLLFLLTLFPALQWIDRLSQKSPKIQATSI